MSTERDKKEDKTMANTNDARRAHDVLDGLSAGRILSKENEQLLRSFLPEPPAQMSLEALRQDVHDVWAGVHGNEWPDDMYCDLETWLAELHTQLKGLKGTPATVTELPVGMRLADHAEHGRIVSIGWLDEKGDHFCVYYDKNYKHGIYALLEADSLTFVDAEPAKPVHPEFLKTEADYRKAPEGTIVACEDSSPWYKSGPEWSSVDFCGIKDNKGMSRARRRVLRWGK